MSTEASTVPWYALPEVDEGPEDERRGRSVDLANSLSSRVSAIRARLTDRYHRQARYGQLYTGALSQDSTSAIEFDAIAASTLLYDSVAVQPLNIVQPIIRSVVAMVTKDRPRVRFVTTGGDDDEQLRGRLIGSFVDGTFEDSMLHDAAIQATYHALVYGTGAIRWYIDAHNKRPACRWVIPMEILFDPDDSVYSSPSEVHERRWYSYDAINAVYPEHKEELSLSRSSTASGRNTPIDYAVVIETHRIPVGEQPGRHVVVCRDVTLVDEPWALGVFPYAFIWWDKPLMGFYGKGLAEELCPAQLKIRQLMSTIAKAQNFFGAPKWWCNTDSGVNSQNLNDDIGNVIKGKGTAPSQLTVANTLPPDMYAYLDWIITQARNQAGISDLFSHGAVPAGMNASGAAQREYADTQSARFSVINKSFMELYKKSAKLCIELQRLAAEADPEARDVKVHDPEGGSPKMNWKDINLDDDRFTMVPMTSAMLPATPTGKLAGAQEAANGGILSHEDYMQLVQYPDIDGSFNDKLLMIRTAKAYVRNMVKRMDESVRPDEVLPINVQLDAATSYYAQELKKEDKEHNPDVLYLLGNFIDACKKLMPPTVAQPPAPVPTVK
jgi:hypothetical protein